MCSRAPKVKFHEGHWWGWKGHSIFNVFVLAIAFGYTHHLKTYYIRDSYRSVTTDIELVKSLSFERKSCNLS